MYKLKKGDYVRFSLLILYLLVKHTFHIFLLTLIPMAVVLLVLITAVSVIDILSIVSITIVKMLIFYVLFILSSTTHELLHFIIMDEDVIVDVKNLWIRLCFESTTNKLRVVTSALLPSLLLFSLGVVMVKLTNELILHLPFLIQILALPLDLYGIVRG